MEINENRELQNETGNGLQTETGHAMEMEHGSEMGMDSVSGKWKQKTEWAWKWKVNGNRKEIKFIWELEIGDGHERDMAHGHGKWNGTWEGNGNSKLT